jgi:hypothetical protein
MTSNEPENLLIGPPPTRLPDDSAVAALIADGTDTAEVAAAHPAYPLPWACLAEQSLRADLPVAAYAYARTGYHRGLDALRRAGWKGHGPIPWEHEPNRGFLRALHALAMAAERIGEADEAARCQQFLRESSAEAARALAAGGPGTPG